MLEFERDFADAWLPADAAQGDRAPLKNLFEFQHDFVDAQAYPPEPRR